MRHFITCCLVLCRPPATSRPSVPTPRLRRVASCAGRRPLSPTGDTRAAADSVLAAARSWPTQPAYWLATARWQGLAGRPAVALEALATLAALGGGWQPDDPRLAPLARQPGFAALRRPRRCRRAVRAWPRCPTRLSSRRASRGTLGTRRLFVGSVHRGSVVVIGDDGAVTSFVPAGTAGAACRLRACWPTPRATCSW